MIAKPNLKFGVIVSRTCTFMKCRQNIFYILFPDSKKRSNFLCSIICCFGKRGGGGSGSRRRQRRKDKDPGGLGGGTSIGGSGGGGSGGSNSRSSAAVGGDAADAAGVIASVGATAPKSGNVGIAASSTGGAKPLLQASSFSL